ncbi:hypothetical protein KKF91_20580 [Myxococcota bacterium]|nr:hypothetical protein [Myxococcota bacterium]MBU1432942.1 hypothetical protein [Myxococcota bacterium]MBU1896244.1 hypothetical protein [Myxococcota bacterium]
MKLALTLLAAALLIGCGGRMHVEEGMGGEVRSLFQAQTQQRKEPGMLSAADANAVIAGHRAVMGGDKKGGDSGGDSGGGGGDLGGLFGGGEGISLQGK